jgi:hypothetical protein
MFGEILTIFFKSNSLLTIFCYFDLFSDQRLAIFLKINVMITIFTNLNIIFNKKTPTELVAYIHTLNVQRYILQTLLSMNRETDQVSIETVIQRDELFSTFFLKKFGRTCSESQNFFRLLIFEKKLPQKSGNQHGLHLFL